MTSVLEPVRIFIARQLSSPISFIKFAYPECVRKKLGPHWRMNAKMHSDNV